jgi:hypothetical protein
MTNDSKVLINLSLLFFLKEPLLLLNAKGKISKSNKSELPRDKI